MIWRQWIPAKNTGGRAGADRVEDVEVFIGHDQEQKWGAAQVKYLKVRLRWFGHVHKRDSKYTGRSMLNMLQPALGKKEDHSGGSWSGWIWICRGLLWQGRMLGIEMLSGELLRQPLKGKSKRKTLQWYYQYLLDCIKGWGNNVLSGRLHREQVQQGAQLCCFIGYLGVAPACVCVCLESLVRGLIIKICG